MQFVSVDRSVRPWTGRPMYAPYSSIDSGRIEVGIQMMLSEPGAKKTLLIPLTPLANGMVYYASAIREERTLKLAQFRLDFTATGVHMRVRSIEVSDGVKAAYPHITFENDHIDQTDSDRLFWSVLHKHCESVYASISLTNSRYMVVGGMGMGLGYDIRNDGWNQPLVPAVHSMYGPRYIERIEIALRDVCAPGADPTKTLLLNDFHSTRHRMAVIRNGPSVNLVDINVVFYPQLNVFERQVIVTPGLALLFPGFQFGSARLTDADTQALFQEPVLAHYRALNERYLMQHYRVPRLTALAMCLTPRLCDPEAGGIASLPRETLMLIASLTP